MDVCKGNGRIEWFRGLLPPAARLITGYGMTETAGYVCALDWHDCAQPESSDLGALLPGAELRIVGAGGVDCPAGESGEVLVRGAGMFSGYYGEAPAAALNPDGWFATGDLGRLDAAGRFHFTGRKKDLLRVKGINVSPVEVENVLAAQPDVEAVYVVGLPADAVEQCLVALVVSAPGRQATTAELQAVATERLSHYKRPEEYIFIDRTEVPFSGTSKPQRHALAALAAGRRSS
jgi:fatty-acyl-CoA synthase